MKATFYNLFFSITSWDFIVFSWVGGGGRVTGHKKNEKISSGGEGKYLQKNNFSSLFKFICFRMGWGGGGEADGSNE